jgi:hypothetical protein
VLCLRTSLPQHINTITPKKRTQDEGGITGAIKTNATAAYDLVPFVTKHREAVVKPLIDNFFKAIKADSETYVLHEQCPVLHSRLAVNLSHSQWQDHRRRILLRRSLRLPSRPHRLARPGRCRCQLPSFALGRSYRL